MKRALGAIALLVAVGVSGCSSKPKPEGEIKAGGSTFVAPLMEKWRDVYAQEGRGNLRYSATGSGAGVFHMIDKSLDFGCTDSPLDAEELLNAKRVGGEVLHIPIALGSVVPAYNLDLDQPQPIRFTGPLLADIYMGKITKWNDPRLQAIQEPILKLPNKDITVVHRSDGSGTTYVFSDYLSTTSSEWREKYGSARAFKWPVGSGQDGNKGVANFVRRTPGAIGYIQLEYAMENDLGWGSVQNRSGNYVQGNVATVIKAVESQMAAIPEDLRFSMANASGENAYPIGSATWAVVYANPPRNSKAIADFLRWAVHDGQKYAQGLYYAPMPPALVERAQKLIDRIGVK
ncbi:MAG: phosphate ABC transporter substrate-binding protein PstS [Gemmataceae bacterium]|nr:phosphate ABC transporter substrate-binding protein PstS [Gemmataceae bacterium]